MAYSKLSCFKVAVEGGIAHVTMDYPPLNLLDGDMSAEFDQLTKDLEMDNEVRVIIFQSALPEYFIAHSGLARVTAGPKNVSATSNFRLTQVIGERMRNMAKVTIAKVEGIARGGGNEIVLAADMSFASLEARFGQPEVIVGVVPGGGSTQRLPHLVGRNRALEILLTGEDYTATLAAQLGMINRAMDKKDLGPYVESLAKRIASFPAHTIAHIKAAVNLGSTPLMPSGLLVEARESDLCVASDITRERVSKGLSLGMETAEGEPDLPSYAAKLATM